MNGLFEQCEKLLNKVENNIEQDIKQKKP